MQRFAGLNSIEGWNLTLQLSLKKEIKKSCKKVLTMIYHYGIIYLVADTQQQLNKCGEVSKWS